MKTKPEVVATHKLVDQRMMNALESLGYVGTSEEDEEPEEPEQASQPASQPAGETEGDLEGDQP